MKLPQLLKILTTGLMAVLITGCSEGALPTQLESTSAQPVAIDPINFDWRFAEGDHRSAIDPGFDDSGWEPVNLPHDWAIDGPFDPDGDPNTGKLPWVGEGWYRKTFELPASAAGQRLQFVFDGIMSHPTVYLNGKEVGSWIYGYNSFQIDATDAARFGGKNVLTVHADTRKHSSRWYPGAGIYRKITMRLVNPVHIPVWGVSVTTPKISDAEATVQVAVDLANSGRAGRSAGVETEIVGPKGAVVATLRQIVNLKDAPVTAQLSFAIPEPMRWDVEHPFLYTARTAVYLEGEVVDRNETRFGIRTFEWTADDGFHLNGRRVRLNGVNEHHTHGMLGAAFFPRAMERKLEILRDMGVNALRTSHNAEAPEVLDMCDRLGIIVFNELFDKWDATAGVPVSTADYVNQYAEREVRNFVLRDRNHPSVVLWSIANEDGAVLRNRDGHSAEHVARVDGYFEKYDPTRPTSMGCHFDSAANRDLHIFEALDTAGWNYCQRYMKFRENYPEKPIIYSETASAFGTRGHYELNLPESKIDYGDDGFLSAYVLTAAPWGDIPEHEFERMRKHDFLAGEFVWTGFDYLGEPTPARGTNSPPELKLEARSSYFGIIDLAGLPKDTYYLYRSQWLKTDHTVHLSPHWNWNAGDVVPVIVYTDGDEAELFLNGKSLGRKAKVQAGARESVNLAFGALSSASSSETLQDSGGNVLKDNTPDKAIDGNTNTRWCASDGRFPQQWQVDLGSVRDFARVNIHWEGPAAWNQYELFASLDARNWFPLEGRYSEQGNTSGIALDAGRARYLKVEFAGHSRGQWASIAEFEVLKTDVGPAQNPYFDIVDAYRIRFLEVAYEPGDLKAVAYQNGEKIGEALVRTAGQPAGVRLLPDRTKLHADGMDLCYVTIEMLDQAGNLCPRAMDTLRFEVEGAASFMGVANGNQIGYDALTDATHSLFYGKAVAVLRSIPGASGPATLTVTNAQGMSAELQVSFE